MLLGKEMRRFCSVSSCMDPGLKSIPCPDKDFRKFVWEKENPDGLERCDGYG